MNLTNEYGTPVTARVCPACGSRFIVCPADPRNEFGDECLGTTCSSYDRARDIDKDWSEAVATGQVRGMPRERT